MATGYRREPLLELLHDALHRGLSRRDRGLHRHSIAAGKPASPTGEDGLRARLLKDAAMRSVREKRAVDVDL